ncbi:N-acetyltransferase family protein [Gordonia iterans]
MIRAATDADLAAVTEIYRHYVQNSTATWAFEAPDERWWRETLTTVSDDGLPFLVAEDESGVQGFAYLGTFRNRAGWQHTVEDTVHLREQAAGRGLGTRLLAALLEAADPVRVREVIAMISGDVEASIALHRRLGFRETGRLPGVGEKFGRTLDCVILQRPLIL